jgi:hypothetical protein
LDVEKLARTVKAEKLARTVKTEKLTRAIILSHLSAALLILGSTQVSHATSVAVGMPCSDPNVQAQRSSELQKILKADQADRAWQIEGKNPTLKNLEKMARNDLKRRKRVGEILGEGCFKTIADYKAAFTVYQHGNTPDQFLQAFLWSKQALKMGDDHMKPDIAEAVDRYLVSLGNKELFGTQAYEPTVGGCWCIQPIEDSFPDSLRDEYRRGKNAAFTGLNYLKTLNKGMTCPAAYCDTNLQPSPQGTVPGFW